MIKFLESRVVPVLVKIGENTVLVAVRNGITYTLPFIIAGSIFLIVAKHCDDIFFIVNFAFGF